MEKDFGIVQAKGLQSFGNRMQGEVDQLPGPLLQQARLAALVASPVIRPA